MLFHRSFRTGGISFTGGFSRPGQQRHLCRIARCQAREQDSKKLVTTDQLAEYAPSSDPTSGNCFSSAMGLCSRNRSTRAAETDWPTRYRAEHVGFCPLSYFSASTKASLSTGRAAGLSRRATRMVFPAGKASWQSRGAGSIPAIRSFTRRHSRWCALDRSPTSGLDHSSGRSVEGHDDAVHIRRL